MYESPITLLVPPELAVPAPRAGSRLAVPMLAVESQDSDNPRLGRLLLGTAVVDRSGRVRDRALLTALGWAEGTRLEIRIAPGTAVLGRSADGAFQIDGRDQVVLPAATRALLGITTGQRVVLVALTDADLLLVHPVAVAAAWIAAHYLKTAGISDEL
jgi:hypothetical protein